MILPPRGVILALPMLAATGCPADDAPPDDPDPLPVPLARVDAWVRVADPHADVFAAGRPDGLVCDETMGYGPEYFGPD